MKWSDDQALILEITLCIFAILFISIILNVCTFTCWSLFVMFYFVSLSLVNVGSEPFSTVLAKSVQYNYTSQADILLALTERTIGER